MTVDEDWITLPQLARELGVGDSTARRVGANGNCHHLNQLECHQT